MKELLIFAFGVAAGSVATYFLVKKHFEDISNEEIDSVKEAYRTKVEALNRVEKIRDEKRKYSNIIFDENYSSRPNEKKDEEDEDTPDLDEDEEEKWEKERIFPEEESETPYSITPNQFVHEKGYYDKISVYYYDEDDVYCYENEELITNPSDLFGSDISFGEFEDDAAYIRNDKLSIDFEILRQHASYSEITSEFDD